MLQKEALMKKTSIRTLEKIRLGVILFCVLCMFLAWLSVPEVFKNTWLFHFGNSGFSNKFFLLPCILIPLLTLLLPMDKSEISEFHGDDEEYQQELWDHARRTQLIVQMATAAFITFCMCLGMLTATQI